MAEPASLPVEISQYHHYIPRFILRNYAHPGLLPKTPTKKNKRGKRKNGPRSPPLILHSIDLSGAEAQITETSVDKTFGVKDMYRDFGKSSKQHEVEEKLSVLESRAAEVINAIRNAFEAGRPVAEMKRPQRDILRKFLFIMKYRGKGFHKRYFHETAEAYDEDDKERMLVYMARKGFKKPIDVWFDNIKGILELKMDYEMKWMKEIHERIYPDDAEWFINNTQQFYMALCTTTIEDQEFLLTQNAYSVHEGASSDIWDSVSGKFVPHAYTEFHVFAPIAPRLIITLRSFLLPVPEEDSDPNIKQFREAQYEANASQHIHPERVGSVLKDLPIFKARNSYSKIVDGKLELINGGPKGSADIFYFPFCAIGSDYVDKINGNMLNESHQIERIVFASKISAYNSLTYYTAHCSEYGLDANRLKNVTKLQHAADLLEADLPVQIMTGRPKPDQFLIDSFSEESDELLALFRQNKKASEIYLELSGNSTLDSKDFSQARGLLYMRIKLDSSTQGLPPDMRENARNEFLDMYDGLSFQVVWIYLKRIRYMKQGLTMITRANVLKDSKMSSNLLFGKEDVVAKARDVFRKERLTRIMHFASFNEALIAKPNWGLVAPLILDDDGLRRVREEEELVLGAQGSLCNCGMPVLEAFASHVRQMAISKKLYEKRTSPFDEIFTKEQKIELITRSLVRETLRNTPDEDLQQNPELEKVIFEVVYPPFGFRQTMEDNEPEGWRCLIQ